MYSTGGTQSQSTTMLGLGAKAPCALEPPLSTVSAHLQYSASDGDPLFLSPRQLHPLVSDLSVVPIGKGGHELVSVGLSRGLFHLSRAGRGTRWARSRRADRRRKSDIEKQHVVVAYV